MLKPSIKLLVLTSSVILCGCSNNASFANDPLGKNHHYMTMLLSNFVSDIEDLLESKEIHKCADCAFVNRIEETGQSDYKYTIYVRWSCGKHDITVYSRNSNPYYAEMTIEAKVDFEYVEFLSVVYDAFCNFTEFHENSFAELENEEHLDTIYGSEIEAYQYWYGSYGKHNARLSKFIDGYQLNAISKIKDEFTYGYWEY